MADELVDKVMEESDKSRLNTCIAILVSFAAAFLSVAHVKSDNIVQSIYAIQNQLVDQWAYFQAKGTKENMALMMVDQLHALKDITSAPEAKAALEARAKDYEEKASKYVKEKAEIEKRARALEAQQSGLQGFDDEFDLCEASMSVALALFAMTALTQKRWLLVLAILLGIYGTVYGGAALLGFTLKPGPIAQMLN